MKTLDELTVRALDRREFTSAALLALLGGVTVTVVGCSDSGSPTQPGPTPPNPGGPSSITGTVSINHGHTAVITGAQLSAGGGVTLDISGTADHPHTVDLTAAEVVQIANRQRVTKTASTNPSAIFGPHNHTVVFN